MLPQRVVVVVVGGVENALKRAPGALRLCKTQNANGNTPFFVSLLFCCIAQKPSPYQVGFSLAPASAAPAAAPAAGKEFVLNRHGGRRARRRLRRRRRGFGRGARGRWGGRRCGGRRHRRSSSCRRRRWKDLWRSRWRGCRQGCGWLRGRRGRWGRWGGSSWRRHRCEELGNVARRGCGRERRGRGGGGWCHSGSWRRLWRCRSENGRSRGGLGIRRLTLGLLLERGGVHVVFVHGLRLREEAALPAALAHRHGRGSAAAATTTVEGLPHAHGREDHRRDLPRGRQGRGLGGGGGVEGSRGFEGGRGEVHR